MKRRNSLDVIERAHLRTNQEIYNENYDHIFGSRESKTLHDGTSNNSEETPREQVQELLLQEEASTLEE